MTALAQRFTWTSVINRLGAPDAEPKVRVPIDYIPHPLDEGMEQLDTPTDGSYIDDGIRVTELTWCVVRHYSDAYDVQLVRLQPSDVALAKRDEPTQAMARHSQISIASLPREAPGLFVTFGAVAGAAIGAWADGGKLPTTERPIVRAAPPVPPVPMVMQEMAIPNPTPAVQNAPRTPVGRPPDVHGTSNSEVALVVPRFTDSETAMNPPVLGRPVDVQQIAEKQASIAARNPRAPRQLRNPKSKAELDERGRFRHTLRLTPQSEQKLQEIADSMGVDLNGAISVCIATYHQALAKRGKVDG